MTLDPRTKFDIALALWVVLFAILVTGCGGNNDDETHPQADCRKTPEVCK